METDWSEAHSRTWEVLATLVPVVEDLDFTAELRRVRDGDLQGVVTITNPTSESALLEYAGTCAPSILIFSPDADEGVPLWDQFRYWQGQVGGCKWFTSILEMPASMSRPAVSTGLASDSIILGDSLPGGTYQAAVRLDVFQPQDTTLVIPAGLVELRR